jgi:hypothetical protein
MVHPSFAVLGKERLRNGWIKKAFRDKQRLRMSGL